MANPQDTGTFDYWITDRLTFQDVPPKSGDTGDFENWIWDRGFWEDYVEATAAPPVGGHMTLWGRYWGP